MNKFYFQNNFDFSCIPRVKNKFLIEYVLNWKAKLANHFYRLNIRLNDK